LTRRERRFLSAVRRLHEGVRERERERERRKEKEKEICNHPPVEVDRYPRVGVDRCALRNCCGGGR
jgi:hypothetical protein